MFKNGEHQLVSRQLTRRILFLTVLIVIPAALLMLDTVSYISLPGKTAGYLETGIVVLLSLLVANLILRLTEKRLMNFLRDDFEIEQRIFISRMYRTTLYLIALMVIIKQLGLSLQGLAIYLGLMTTGIAFAVRDILLSYFVWIIILLKKPFRMNDYIRLDDTEGRITHIGTFYLTLDTCVGNENKLIRIPNKIVLNYPVVNLGHEELIYDFVSLHLFSLPPRQDEKLKKLEQAIVKLLPSDKPVHCWFSSNTQNLLLTISFYADPDIMSSTKSMIINEAIRIFKGAFDRPSIRSDS